MNALVFLLLALLISAIGSAALVLRNRRPTSVESGIDEFRREMSALAPPERPRRARPEAPGPRTDEVGPADDGRDDQAHDGIPGDPGRPHADPAEPEAHAVDPAEPRSAEGSETP